MSGTGLDLETGILTDPNPMEIEVKQAMAKSAQRIVLLLDASKLGLRSVQQVLQFDEVVALLIDDCVSPEQLKRLKALGMKVVVA